MSARLSYRVGGASPSSENRPMSANQKTTFIPYVAPERPIRSYDTWADDRRALPNELIRTSLFAVSKRTEIEREIASVDGLVIRYKGVPLDQSHLDVFAAVTHLARGLAADATIRTTRYELLTTIGWKPNDAGAKGFAWIWKRLSDLTAGTILVEDRRRKVATGSLLASVAMDENTERITIALNQHVRPLFDFSTHLNSRTRHSLTSPLDKWMHAFLSSHTATYPMKVDTYHRLSGSTSPMKEFSRQLKACLGRLKDSGIIDDWDIANGLVMTQRTPTRSQIRRICRSKTSASTQPELCPF